MTWWLLGVFAFEFSFALAFAFFVYVELWMVLFLKNEESMHCEIRIRLYIFEDMNTMMRRYNDKEIRGYKDTEIRGYGDTTAFLTLYLVQ